MTKEAEFALKQAFAYCPYSPEAVFHLMELLLRQNRIDDALAILQTCHKLDPYSGQISDWIERLSRSKTATTGAADDRVKQAFAEIQRDIANNQTNAAQQKLEQITKLAGTDPNILMSVASAYLSLGNQAKSDEGRLAYLGKSEEVVEKLTQVLPDAYEPLYNLAVIQAARGENAKAVASLKKSLALNAKDPKGDLRKHMFDDPTFVELRKSPEFQTAFGAKP